MSVLDTDIFPLCVTTILDNQVFSSQHLLTAELKRNVVPMMEIKNLARNYIDKNLTGATMAALLLFARSSLMNH